MPPNRTASKRRRNTSQVRTLKPADVDGRTHPRLGQRDDGNEWHPRVKAWWSDLWGSAAVADLDVSDRLAVWQLADLHHRRILAGSNAEIVRLSTEARSMARDLGLSPRARTQAKVEIAAGERADDARLKRRNRKAATSVATPAEGSVAAVDMTPDQIKAAMLGEGTA